MVPDIFLPVVVSPGPRFGCQVDDDIAGFEGRIVPGRLYQTPARWAGIDPWLGRNVAAFGDNPFIIGTKTCPLEYRLWPDFLGSPPQSQYYGEFGEWASTISREYHPWGIEIWNEPDVPRQFSVPEYFGSWVDEDDFYLAGRAYGLFCAAVYEQIHATGAQVIAGALLGGESSLVFAAGMMDGGLRCDYVSYHKYLGMGDPFDTGFVFADRLREIVNVPLIWNETNILGDGSPTHQAKQAEYVKYLRERCGWEGVAGVLIYSFHNWMWENAALIIDGDLTPAYMEFAR